MMQLKCVCFIVVVLAGTDAYKCCPPGRWKAKTFHTRLELQNNVGNYYWEHGEFYQDLTNKRFASVVERRYYGYTQHLKTISDQRNMLKYKIDRDGQRCSVEYNHDPEHSFCVPDSATPGFQVKQGFGKNSLEATAYYDEDILKDGKYQRGVWYIVNEACIPLQLYATGLYNANFLESDMYGSISTDYDDSIFDIPSICPTVIPPSNEKTMNFLEVVRYKAAIEKLNQQRP